jgi:hypothetical protein
MSPRWIVAGLLAPLAILAHEAGHALVSLARGCADVAIHYQYASGHCDDGRVAGDVAQLAGGPLTSWLLVLGGWWLARTRKCPEALILAVCCAGRALIGLEAIVTSSQTDESRMAVLANVPSALFVVPQVLLTIATFVWARRFARRNSVGREALIGMAIACASGALYMFVVAPSLLP